MRWSRRNRTAAVLGIVAIVFALAFPATPAAPLGSRAGADAVDYLHVPFETRQVLDWGDRPNWSPDGRRIAFVLDAPQSGPYAGKSSLYVGEFRPTSRLTAYRDADDPTTSSS